MKKHLGKFLVVMLKSAKLVKSLKVIKVIVSSFSMLLFAVCESWILGVAMACALLVLLFLHEMGHVIAMKQKGFGLRMPYFIPFIGAVVFAPRMEERDTEAYVGFGGPLLGTFCALLFTAPYLYSGHSFWLAGAFLGLFLNLFNMVPISPFDGGRVTQAADRRLRYIGYALLMAFTVFVGEPGMLLLWVFVVSELEWSLERKYRVCSIIFVVMTTLTVLHVGKSFWPNCLDCLLVLAFTSMFKLFLISKKSRIKAEEKLTRILIENKERLDPAEVEALMPKPNTVDALEIFDTRPQLALQPRIIWFVLWLGLVLIQVYTMIGITHLLKK